MSGTTASKKRISTRALVITGVLVALVLAGFVSYYASSHPDGLNYVAEKQGFIDTEKAHRSSDDSPMAGYATKGVDDDRLSGAIAGVSGTLLVLCLAGGWALLVRRRTSSPA